MGSRLRNVRLRTARLRTPRLHTAHSCSLSYTDAPENAKASETSRHTRTAENHHAQNTHAQPTPAGQERYRCRDSVQQAMTNAVHEAVVALAGDCSAFYANRINHVPNPGIDAEIRAKMRAAHRRPGPPRIVIILAGGVAR